MTTDNLSKHSIVKRLRVIDRFILIKAGFGDKALVLDKVALQCINEAFKKICNADKKEEQEE